MFRIERGNPKYLTRPDVNKWVCCTLSGLWGRLLVIGHRKLFFTIYW